MMEDNKYEIKLKEIYGRLERLEHFTLDVPSASPDRETNADIVIGGRCNDLRRKLKDARAELQVATDEAAMLRRTIDEMQTQHLRNSKTIIDTAKVIDEDRHKGESIHDCVKRIIGERDYANQSAKQWLKEASVVAEERKRMSEILKDEPIDLSDLSEWSTVVKRIIDERAGLKLQLFWREKEIAGMKIDAKLAKDIKKLVADSNKVMYVETPVSIT